MLPTYGTLVMPCPENMLGYLPRSDSGRRLISLATVGCGQAHVVVAGMGISCLGQENGYQRTCLPFLNFEALSQTWAIGQHLITFVGFEPVLTQPTWKLLRIARIS